MASLGYTPLPPRETGEVSALDAQGAARRDPGGIEEQICAL